MLFHNLDVDILSKAVEVASFRGRCVLLWRRPEVLEGADFVVVMQSSMDQSSGAPEKCYSGSWKSAGAAQPMLRDLDKLVRIKERIVDCGDT